jgi:hypothetical protein
MKKNIVAVLLVIALSTAAAFATNPDASDSFQVETSVSGKHGLKLVAPGTVTPTNYGQFNLLSDATPTSFTINDDNYKTDDLVARKMIAMSNNRTGYVVTMSASAMASPLTSGSAYINYIVKAGGATVITDNGTVVNAAANVYTSATELSTLSIYATDVTITVNESNYEAAVTGTYTGTVTFNLKAN